MPIASGVHARPFQPQALTQGSAYSTPPTLDDFDFFNHFAGPPGLEFYSFEDASHQYDRLAAYNRASPLPTSGSPEWSRPEVEGFFDFPEMIAGARRIHRYLEGLKENLTSVASRKGWRVAEAGHTNLPWAYLLVPCPAESPIAVVRGYRMRDLDDSAGLLTPYDGCPWVDRGAAEWHDVPSIAAGSPLDRRFVWVCSDPADAILLETFGVTAISLATPCKSLSSEEGMNRLAALGSITLTRERRGTIIVVDSTASLDDGESTLLCSLFEHVWSVCPDLTQVVDGKSHAVVGSLSITGRGLADLLRNRPLSAPDPVAWAESLLLKQVQKVGRRHEAAPPQSVRVTEPAKLTRLTSPAERPAFVRPVRDVMPRTAEEILAASKPRDQGWIAEPFAAPGRFTDVQGAAFAGKSTLLLSMASAVAEGATFLGRPCKASPVLYITEQYVESLHDNLSNHNKYSKQVKYMTAEDHEGMTMTEIGTMANKLCNDIGSKLVIFDTIYRIAGMMGGPSNSPQRIQELFRVLRPLARGGAAVVLVRHSGEGNGDLSRTGAGSRAFSAEVDYSFRLRKSPRGKNFRTVEVESRRHGVNDFMVERMPDGSYVLVEENSSGEAWSAVAGKSERGTESLGRVRRSTRWNHNELDAEVKRVLIGVPSPGLTSSQVVERLKSPTGEGPGRTTVDKSLSRLEAERQVIVNRPTEGRPIFRYALAGQ